MLISCHWGSVVTVAEDIKRDRFKEYFGDKMTERKEGRMITRPRYLCREWYYYLKVVLFTADFFKRKSSHVAFDCFHPKLTIRKAQKQYIYCIL